jgi:hypothetical protein
MAIFQIHLPGSDPALQAELASELVGAGRVEPSRIQPKDLATIVAVISGGAQVAEILYRWYQRKRNESSHLEQVMIATPAGQRVYLRDVSLEALRRMIDGGV